MGKANHAKPATKRGEEPWRQLAGAAWGPLREALGPAARAGGEPFEVSWGKSKLDVKHPRLVEAALMAALSGCEAAAAERALEKRALTNRMGMSRQLRAKMMDLAGLDALAADGCARLARMGFFKEALEGVARGGGELDAQRALAELMKEAARPEEPGWSSGMSMADKFKELARSSAWNIQLVASDHEAASRQDQLSSRWVGPLAAVGLAMSRGEAATGEAGAELLERFFEIKEAPAEEWALFDKELAAALIDCEELAQGGLPADFWGAMHRGFQGALARAASFDSALGRQCVERLIERVESSTGSAKEAVGRVAAAWIWCSLDEAKIKAFEERFPQDGPRWVAEGLMGENAGLEHALMDAWESDHSLWARKALAEAGLASPRGNFPAGDSGEWVDKDAEGWASRFELLRSTMLAWELRGEIAPHLAGANKPRL